MTHLEQLKAFYEWEREHNPHPQGKVHITEWAYNEIVRLNAALKYEQHRTGRVGTHGPNCWSWGPAHYECALREIERREIERRILESEQG